MDDTRHATEPRDAQTRELYARLRTLGFTLEGLGGNCEALVRQLEAGRYEQLYTEPLWAPTAEDSPIWVGTLGPDAEEASDLRMYASLADAVEALERARNRRPR